jgi:hypothetical protein
MFLPAFVRPLYSTPFRIVGLTLFTIFIVVFVLRDSLDLDAQRLSQHLGVNKAAESLGLTDDAQHRIDQLLAEISQLKQQNQNQNNSPPKLDAIQDEKHDALSTQPRPDCTRVSGAEKIFLILKSGASAAYTRIPVHFSTTLKCAHHYMISTELAETIGDFTIHDAITNVTAETVADSQFDHYRQVQLWHKMRSTGMS